MEKANRKYIFLGLLICGTTAYLTLNFLVLPSLTYHYKWQIRGQQEYTGIAKLTERYTNRSYRTTRYTCYLIGKGEAPSFQLEEDIFWKGADSSLVDREKMWNALQSASPLSEIPIKWTIAKNGKKVFTEVNGNRKIGGTSHDFEGGFHAFLMASFIASILIIVLITSFFKN